MVLNNQQQADVAVLDFLKAFDKVLHQRLQHKLNYDSRAYDSRATGLLSIKNIYYVNRIKLLMMLIEQVLN